MSRPRMTSLADHGQLDVPFIDEHAGDRADDRQRRQKRDQDHADLGRRAVKFERDVRQDREKRDEIAENTDDLRDPEPFYGANSQHVVKG